MKSSNTKTKKVRAEGHTAPTKTGMGDYYGQGIRQPFGRLRDSTLGFERMDKKEIHTPPRKLA